MNADNTIISADRQAESIDNANKRTYTVQEIQKLLNISKTKAYTLCSEDHFRIIKIGRAIRVSKASFDEWLDKQT